MLIRPESHWQTEQSAIASGGLTPGSARGVGEEGQARARTEHHGPVFYL
jgi:hypothetical protein